MTSENGKNNIYILYPVWHGSNSNLCGGAERTLPNNLGEAVFWLTIEKPEPFLDQEPDP
jgi:hypothetical protein